MIEATNSLIVLTLALAALAALAWFRLSRGTGFQNLGRAGESKAGKTEWASKLLMLAVVSSGLAASLAVAERIRS
jgi:hypothetical protein